MKNNYLKFIYISNGIFIFASSLLFPIFAIYINRYTVDLAVISLVSSVFLASTAIFLAILARVGARMRNHSKYLIIGFLLRTLGWFSFLFVTDISQIILLQVLLGLGEAVGSTFFDVILAEHLDKGKYVEDYATWKLIQNLGGAAAAAMGGIIAEFYGFHYVFIIMTVLSIVSAGVFYLGTKEHSKVYH